MADYVPTMGMVRELARVSEEMPAGDWMDRQRCQRRGLVDLHERLTIHGENVLNRAVQQFRMFGDRKHGR